MVAIVLGLSYTAAAVPAVPAGAVEKPIFLETHRNQARVDYVARGATKARLTTGKPYVVSVRGTWSFFDTSSEGKLCGLPERRPMYPSPGVRNRRAVADAEWYFAQFARRCGDPSKIIVPGIRFMLAPGDIYVNPVPLGPTLTRPSPSHTYRYAVLGENRRLRFRIADVQPRDNYGRLRVVVRAATVADCARYGGPVFALADDATCVAATQLPG